MEMPSSRYVFGIIPWYSLLIVCGAGLAVWLAARHANRAGLPRDTILDLALFVLPVGILGARLYYVIFSWNDFRQDPLSILRIWEGGLAIYGGLIAGFLVVLLFSLRRKIPLRTLLDCIVPGVALAQAIGRWGNYFNMEAYGLPIQQAGFQFFPVAVLIPGQGGFSWHMATFFYESVCDFLLFLFLTRLFYRHRRKTGDVLFFYFLGYGCSRLLIEQLRTDSLYSASIRVSQLVSFVLIAFVFILFFCNASGASSGRQKAARLLLLSIWGLLSLLSFSVIMHIFIPAFSEMKTQILLLAVYGVLSWSFGLLLYRMRRTEES